MNLVSYWSLEKMKLESLDAKTYGKTKVTENENEDLKCRQTYYA